MLSYYNKLYVIYYSKYGRTRSKAIHFHFGGKKWTKTSKDFITGIYMLVECAAFAPQIIRESFADVNLWPWNTEEIRSLCGEHCCAPSQHNESRVLR